MFTLIRSFNTPNEATAEQPRRTAESAIGCSPAVSPKIPFANQCRYSRSVKRDVQGLHIRVVQVRDFRTCVRQDYVFFEGNWTGLGLYSTLWDRIRIWKFCLNNVCNIWIRQPEFFGFQFGKQGEYKIRIRIGIPVYRSWLGIGL